MTLNYFRAVPKRPGSRFDESLVGFRAVRVSIYMARKGLFGGYSIEFRVRVLCLFGELCFMVLGFEYGVYDFQAEASSFALVWSGVEAS